jgi:phage-related protein (TIGR01555 family)
MGVRNFFDGLVNAISGLGFGNDPRAHNRYMFLRLSDEEIFAAFRASWLIRKIIVKPAADMVREWRDWQTDKPNIEKLEAEETRLGVREKFKKAEILRGLGGAAMVIYIADDDQEQPLDPKRIRAGSITDLHVWHRSRFSVGQSIDTWGDPWFGHPSYYQVNLTGPAKLVKFHPSRVITFRGDEPGDSVAMDWQDIWWGDSKVQVVRDAVDNVHTSENGFAALIKDAHNRRLYVPKLTERLATTEDEGRFRKRAQALAVGESSLGVTFLDGGDSEGKGGEKLDDRQMVWAGIPDIKASYLAVAAAAANMPETVLLGRSPAGMNATGKGDQQIWEAEVKSRQDLEMRPCLARLDVALIPSALGKVDEKVWFQFAPLSTPTEAEEATTFKTTMEAVTALQNTGSIPDEAFSKGLQNLLSERGWVPGLDDALSEIPEDERFGLSAANDDDDEDPSALQAGGATPAPRRRAANDARFTDAAPRTLYVQRKLLNADDLIRWAKKEGFETTTPADEIHVTITFSRRPLDWMKIGQDWSSDKDGTLVVPAGGARLVEPLGDKGAVVLLFSSNDLKWRHDAMIEAGASFDFDEYQPHVTITYAKPAGLDLAKVKPYVGPLKFGPELFSEVVDDWEKTIIEDAEDEQRRPFGDGKSRRGRSGSHRPNSTYRETDHPRGTAGRWTSKGDRIEAHVEQARLPGHQHARTSLGTVSSRNAAKVKTLTGVDIAGHERVLETSDIRHVLKNHGSEAREAARGQRAISNADLARIPKIVERAHSIRAIGEAGRRKLQRLEYTASIDGHEYQYVEEIRPNAQIVALKSMRKS